jgi:hypothetical protein
MLLLSVERQTCTGDTELYQEQQEQDEHVLCGLLRSSQLRDDNKVTLSQWHEEVIY